MTAARMLEPVTAYARANGLSRWAKMTGDIVTYHTSPVEAAEAAKAAGVRLLALTHIVPPLPNFIARHMFLEGVSAAWDGEVVLGKDRMHFEMGPDGKAVHVDMLN